MTPEALSQRYALLCQSTRVEPDEKMLPYEIEKGLNQLEHIITRDLREWAQSGAPDNFFNIDFALQQELERFKEFCAYPALSQKFVVAFGGGFSAGKSTLINTLLGEKLLVAEVDPTTALPTYILRGENNTINAFNLFGNRIELTESEFLSLTHDELQIYGSNISRLLRAAFITRCDFEWNNIAFIDTPGYTKHEDGIQSDRTDAHIARTQLNAAQAVVWVIDVRQGCITEDDLKFLKGLQKDIQIFIVLTRADQKPEDDIPAIQNLISKTLQEHGIAFSGIIPISSRKPRAYPLDRLKQQLNQWNQSPCELRFATNFNTELNRCAEFLQTQLQQATNNLNHLNRIVAINENETIQADATALQKNAKEKLETLKNHINQFQNIQTQFLDKLIEIGKMVGVDFLQSLEISKEKNKIHEKIIEPSFITTKHGLQINNDGTVFDPKTNLMWKRECELDCYTYREAIEKFEVNYSFAGYSDWRLPSIEELKTLLLKENHYIDEEAFFDSSKEIGSSTLNFDFFPTHSFSRVDFSNGKVDDTFFSTNIKLVRNTRDGKSYKNSLFGLKIYSDSTIFDERTSLMWKRECESGKYTYDEAIEEFKGYHKFAGYDNWRLPTIHELITILLSQDEEPYFDEKAFPDAGDDWFWSSDRKYDNRSPMEQLLYVLKKSLRSDLDGSDEEESEYFVAVNFNNGKIMIGDYGHYKNLVRLVRTE